MPGSLSEKRSIPAWAGETAADPGYWRQSAVYPCGGGGTATAPEKAPGIAVYPCGGGGNGRGGRENGAGGLGSEDQVRREGKDLGLVVSRKGRRGEFRPAVQEDGRLRQTFRLDGPIRRRMEQALVHYFDTSGSAL